MSPKTDKEKKEKKDKTVKDDKEKKDKAVKDDKEKKDKKDKEQDKEKAKEEKKEKKEEKEKSKTDKKEKKEDKAKSKDEKKEKKEKKKDSPKKKDDSGLDAEFADFWFGLVPEEAPESSATDAPKPMDTSEAPVSPQLEAAGDDAAAPGHFGMAAVPVSAMPMSPRRQPAKAVTPVSPQVQPAMPVSPQRVPATDQEAAAPQPRDAPAMPFSPEREPAADHGASAPVSPPVPPSMQQSGGWSVGADASQMAPFSPERAAPEAPAKPQPEAEAGWGSWGEPAAEPSQAKAETPAKEDSDDDWGDWESMAAQQNKQDGNKNQANHSEWKQDWKQDWQKGHNDWKQEKSDWKQDKAEWKQDWKQNDWKQDDWKAQGRGNNKREWSGDNSWQTDKWARNSSDQWASGQKHGQRSKPWDKRKQAWGDTADTGTSVQTWDNSDWGSNGNDWNQNQSQQQRAPQPPNRAPSPYVQPGAAPVEPAVPLSNPQEVLMRIGVPITLQQWNDVQDDVWEGHPALPPNWIRCWSRNQSKEYFVNVITMASTFDNNALA